MSVWYVRKLKVKWEGQYLWDKPETRIQYTTESPQHPGTRLEFQGEEGAAAGYFREHICARDPAPSFAPATVKTEDVTGIIGALNRACGLPEEAQA